MKIATFNVNNINRRLPNLLQWLKSARPEHRLPAGAEINRREFSDPRAIEKAGYRAVSAG